MKITLDLTEEQVVSLNQLFNCLAYDPRYYDVPYPLYQELDALIFAINSEVATYMMTPIEDKKEENWKEQACFTCKHIAYDHSSGTGICCKESCECEKFVKS